MVAGRFTLIQQNDIHAQLEPHPEWFRDGGAVRYRPAGGLARAATIVNAVRAETSASVLVDCGDAIYGTLPAMRTEGAAVVPALNALGVQLLTPGNWEYGFGPAALQERMEELDCPVIACNVERAEDGAPLFEPHHVMEMDGVPVGFLGITSPIIPQMSPVFAEGLRFPDVRQRVAHGIARLRDRERVALVVLVSHLGFAQDVALARELDGIDIILSGHTHNRLARPARAGGALIIQSGFSGSFLGQLDVEVNNGRICGWTHQLIALDERVVPDERVSAVIDASLAPFREEMQEVVGETTTPLDRMGLLETTMDNFITDAYRSLTGSDIALSHGWRFAPPVTPGPVTAADLWAMVPTNPRLFTARITGRELLQMIEDNLQQVLAGDALQQAGGYIVRTSGLTVVFRPNNGRGVRVDHMEVNGAAVEQDREYDVVGAGSRHLHDARDRRDLDMTSIDALRRYLAKGPVSAELTHSRFIAH